MKEQGEVRSEEKKAGRPSGGCVFVGKRWGSLV